MGTRTLARPAVRERPLNPVAAWGAVALFVLVSWSLSYIARQPGVQVGDAPTLLGDFALEGLLLSTAWLGAILAATVAALSGLIVIRER